tara:strand:+ start:305 stop:769 length:465 start_codon:yes stop_codon:yes gene_type:complete
MKHSGKNPSELKCEEFYSKRKNSFILIRYGLDQWANPDMTWNNWEKIKPFIRKTPDYIIVSKEKNQSYLLEVKSAKETFMLKKEDWEQYDKWDWIDSDEDNLIFYIYDFESKTQKHVKMSKIRKIVKSGEYKWEWIDEDTPRPKEVMYIPFELL